MLNVGGQPQNVGGQPQNVGGQPQNVGGQPQNVGAAHGAQNRHVGGFNNLGGFPPNAAQNANIGGGPNNVYLGQNPNVGAGNFHGVAQNQNLRFPAQNAPFLFPANFPQQNFPQQQRLVQMFPREFRMNGSISDDISKSMKYLDICRQVADGQRKGYSEDEILSGLRRAISTGSVKTYIDSQANVPLEEILLFLRSFLKERTPAELHNDLSQLVQLEGQEAIKFFMDAIQIRQLIVVGSQVEGNVTYDPRLVNSTFLHTIRTGLRDETVRAHMLPLLSDTNPVDDNTLIRELHRAVGESEERKKKLLEMQQQQKKATATAKVNVVESNSELAQVLKQLEENRNQMNVVQEQVKELIVANQKKQPWKRKGCQACTDNNKVNTCSHCWKCGEDGHKSQNCPKPK